MGPMTATSKIPEGFKLIPFKHNDSYCVNCLGQAYSLKSGKFLKLNERGGYLALAMWLKDKQHKISVHRAVVTTFLGPIPEGMCVNHLDFNKHNNCLSNLEVISYSENTKHAIKHGVLKPYTKLDKLQVNCIRLLIAQKQLTYREIGALFNVERNTICHINVGKTWRVA